MHDPLTVLVDERDSTCVFCEIVARTAPATMVREWPDAIAFVPLNPVADGHVLVVPRAHVRDAVESPDVTALTMRRAVELARESASSNILTSVGAPATQSVFHLHVHVIARSSGDQLMVPWGTTGDPHEPHRCKGMDAHDSEVARLRAGEADEPAPEGTELTPAQFIRKMNDATPERRLEMAARALEASRRASHCWRMDHEARLEDVERTEREARKAMLMLVKAAGGQVRIPERVLLETDFDTEVLTRWDERLTGETVCEARGGENEAVHNARVDAENEAFLNARRPLPPAPALGASCDAGQCDTPSTGWRWYPDGRRWLPVCIPHGREDLPNYVPDTAMVERIHPGDDGGTDG